MTLPVLMEKLLRREWACVGLILLLALALRLCNLDATTLWIDEIYSLMVANVHVTPHHLPAQVMTGGDFYRQYLAWQPMNWPALLEALKINVHMPLYYLLLNPWLGAFGNNAIGLRSFSAVCSTLMLIPVYWLGKALGGGQRAGLLSMLVAALVPFQLYYGQEGRMYALSLFWAAWTGLAFWKTLYGKRPLPWSLLYAVCVSGGLLSHYMFVFFLGFQALYAGLWLLKNRNKKRFLYLGFALVAVIGIACWWAPVYQIQQQGVNDEYHFAKGLMDWSRYATAVIWQPLIVVAGDNLWERVFYLPFTVLLFLLYLFKPGNSAAKNSSFQREGFLLCWIFAPLLLQIGYDFLKHTHTSVIDRYAMLISPAMCLWMGLSLDYLIKRRPWLANSKHILANIISKLLNPALILPIMGLLAVALVAYPSPFRDEHNKDKDIRGKFQWMTNQARPTDLVFVNGPWGAALTTGYYLRRQRPEQPMFYWINQHQGQAVPLPAPSLLSAYQRVWLFRYRANNERGLQQAKEYLQSQFPRLTRTHDWFIYERH